MKKAEELKSRTYDRFSKHQLKFLTSAGRTPTSIGRRSESPPKRNGRKRSRDRKRNIRGITTVTSTQILESWSTEAVGKIGARCRYYYVNFQRVYLFARAHYRQRATTLAATAATSSSIVVRETGTSERESRGTPRRRVLIFSLTDSKEARKLAPEVRIKQIGMREDLLSIIRHTSSDHFSEEL